MSSSFMDSVDLQNGVFEDQGMQMLEEWEKNSTLMLMGGAKAEDKLDINAPRKEALPREEGKKSSYDNLFDN